MTEEEIINAAVERALLLLPEVFANLLDKSLEQVRVNKEFYDKYPEFKDHKEVVVSVVQKLDEQSPGMGYKEIIEKAVPEIRKRLDMMEGMNFSTVRKPNV